MNNGMNNESIIKVIQEFENAVGKIHWVDSYSFTNIETCLKSINFDTFNSGAYNPKACRIKGVKGFFLINEDGTVFPFARVIKESDAKYQIERLTSQSEDLFLERYKELQPQ